MKSESNLSQLRVFLYTQVIPGEREFRHSFFKTLFQDSWNNENLKRILVAARKVSNLVERIDLILSDFGWH